MSSRGRGFRVDRGVCPFHLSIDQYWTGLGKNSNERLGDGWMRELQAADRVNRSLKSFSRSGNP